MSSESSELLLLYRSALNDITPHAEKVVINNLTTIAMENIDNAPIIVKAIEDHIYNVSLIIWCFHYSSILFWPRNRPYLSKNTHCALLLEQAKEQLFFSWNYI